jgi:hypothetical protein
MRRATTEERRRETWDADCGLRIPSLSGIFIPQLIVQSGTGSRKLVITGEPQGQSIKS